MATIATVDRSQAPASGERQGSKLISWNPSHELDPHEWAAAGRRIGAVGRCIQWLLGDWIAYGNTKFGERYTRASKITGYDPQTLMNMVYVASRFSISRRRENLSWSHHEALASMDPSEQNRWLDEASEHRWSVLDLRMMLRAARKERKEEEELSPGGADALAARGPGERAQAAVIFAGDGSAKSGKPTGQSADAPVICPHCGKEVT
ncbi:MAG TPA: hypothetical protein VGC63_12435 [Solirubrobacterales bacterium]|jgi:hypothetical protein